MIERVMMRCRECTRWWSVHPDDVRIGSRAQCSCEGELDPVDMKAHIASLPDGVMRDRLVEMIHKFTRDKFPIRFVLLSGKDGSVVWERTVELPEGKDLQAVQIPSFAGTEHYPVRARVECADGTAQERAT